MATKKTVDVPPQGDRNPDPMTGEPGAHPVEVGIGAAITGAAAAAAAATVTGPVGMGIAAAAGAVAGGLTGKGVGEMIDPTTEDTWLRDNYSSRPYVKEGDRFETHVPAYRYGARAEAEHGDKPFHAMEDYLRTNWSHRDMDWDAASPAIMDGYERARAIRKSRKS